MQISAKKIRPYVQIFIYAAFLAAGIGLFLFLKTYFYPAITGSQNIIQLQRNMAAETININEFNRLIESIDKKTSQQPTKETISDPFK